METQSRTAAPDAFDATVYHPESDPSATELIPLTAILARVLGRWRRILAIGFGCAVLGVALSFTFPREYTAQASFTPEASSSSRLGGSLGGLSGLAGQLGLPAGLLGGSVSSDYYASVLQSRELIEEILQKSYTFGSGSERRTVTLIDYLKVRADTPQERLARAVRKFRHKVSTLVDKKTNVVELDVELRSPELAAAVANEMLAALNRFNLERKQSQSRAQRIFVEQQRNAAIQQLHDAENRQLGFLQTNRGDLRASPTLQVQAARLERDVQQAQQLFLSLNQAYQEARIAEVQDTPVLTVIDHAVPPDRRSYPPRFLFGLALMFFGIAAAIAREAMRSGLGLRHFATDL